MTMAIEITTDGPIGTNGLDSLFRPAEKGGEPYWMSPDVLIAKLRPKYRAAAYEVWHVLLKYLREWKKLDERLITRLIAQELKSTRGHRCYSFVQKGLYALEKILGLIRRVRKHGRRIIEFVRGLLGKGR